MPPAAGAGAGTGAGHQDWLTLSETALNFCGHVTGLIIATLNLHNNRSSEVNKKSVVPASPKYIKVQSV